MQANKDYVRVVKITQVAPIAERLMDVELQFLPFKGDEDNTRPLSATEQAFNGRFFLMLPYNQPSVRV